MPIELVWIACVLVAGVGTLIFGLMSGERLPAPSSHRHHPAGTRTERR